MVTALTVRVIHKGWEEEVVIIDWRWMGIYLGGRSGRDGRKVDGKKPEKRSRLDTKEWGRPIIVQI